MDDNPVFVRVISEEIKRWKMGRRKTNLLRVFDNVGLMVDAVNTLMDDYRDDIVNFVYLQVRVNTDVDMSFDGASMRDVAKMMQNHRSHRSNSNQDAINRDSDRNDRMRTLHALDLKVKGNSFDKIDTILWSAGGFPSHRPSGWFRLRAKQNVQFVWAPNQFFRILSRIARRGG